MEIQKQVKFAKERLRTMGDIESINNRMSELETEKKMLKNTGLVDGLISPASVARLKEINAELEKLRKLTSTKDTVAKDKELDLFGVKQDIYGIAYDLAKDMATITNRAMEIYTTDFAGKGMTDKSLPNMWRGGFFKPMEKLDEEIKKPVVEAEKELKGIEQAANMAGNAVSNAFLNGGNAIDAATQALKQFIVQLLVVQSMNFLLRAIFAPSSLPTTIAGFLGFEKNIKPSYSPTGATSLPATPELSRVISSANNIAQRQNSAMVVNVQGELVGSGSNLKAIIKKRDTITAKYY